jgi:hypothetical protein
MGTGIAISKGWMNFPGMRHGLSFIHIGWNPLEHHPGCVGGGIWGYPRTSYNNTPFLGYLLSFLLISRDLIFDFDFFLKFLKKAHGLLWLVNDKKLWWNCGQSKNRNHPLSGLVRH